MLDVSWSPCRRSHPAGGATSRQPACDGPCCLRAVPNRSASGAFSFGATSAFTPVAARGLAHPPLEGRVERWRARGSVRWRSHGFRRGPQSGSHSDVSSAPPKIPCIEFSPARLQAKVCCHQPDPSRTDPELKCQVHIPSGASRFDLTFVAYVPPADYRWHYQPARLRLTQQRPPRPTGPSLRAGYSVPLISATTARSASLARTP